MPTTNTLKYAWLILAIAMTACKSAKVATVESTHQVVSHLDRERLLALQFDIEDTIYLTNMPAFSTLKPVTTSPISDNPPPMLVKKRHIKGLIGDTTRHHWELHKEFDSLSVQDHWPPYAAASPSPATPLYLLYIGILVLVLGYLFKNQRL